MGVVSQVSIACDYAFQVSGDASGVGTPGPLEGLMIVTLIVEDTWVRAVFNE